MFEICVGLLSSHPASWHEDLSLAMKTMAEQQDIMNHMLQSIHHDRMNDGGRYDIQYSMTLFESKLN
jgi:hypothetical protein